MRREPICALARSGRHHALYRDERKKLASGPWLVSGADAAAIGQVFSTVTTAQNAGMRTGGRSLFSNPRQ